MARRLALALLVVAGCGVKLEQGSDVSTGDARSIDAPVGAAPDAPPDARPCTGGDAHMTDPMGSCFVVFLTPALYVDAQAACAAIGAHLATVASASTNTLITQLGQNTAAAFLGASDAVTENTFVWQDGTPLSYTNWRSGEPNNGGGSYEEDCVVIQPMLAGVWDDRPCAPPPDGAGAYSYVCQY